MAQEEQPTILVGYVCNARLQYSRAYFHDHYLLPRQLSTGIHALSFLVISVQGEVRSWMHFFNA